MFSKAWPASHHASLLIQFMNSTFVRRQELRERGHEGVKRKDLNLRSANRQIYATGRCWTLNVRSEIHNVCRDPARGSRMRTFSVQFPGGWQEVEKEKGREKDALKRGSGTNERRKWLI
ncbi:putative calcium-binding protein [Anopheles sinensis]|uniref:Putative calcium-binding protein n=1 Tax=Anopheles sinensis TaxID=74873 RepID=A0A084WRV9_ANOSI|nr:putative calcium-binding protein [Anopheles sinensis]